MANFSLAVLLPAALDPRDPLTVSEAVGRALHRYDENRAVTPYWAPIDPLEAGTALARLVSAGRLPSTEIHKDPAAEIERHPFGSPRHFGICDALIAAFLPHPPAVGALGDYFSAPVIAADGAFRHETDANPEARFAWWEIGGSWSGAWSGGWNGDPSRFDILRRRELPDLSADPGLLPSALVDRRGDWHARPDDPGRWAAEAAALLAAGPADEIVALVDCHP
jgi:hypothetical protein